MYIDSAYVSIAEEMMRFRSLAYVWRAYMYGVLGCAIAVTIKLITNDGMIGIIGFLLIGGLCGLWLHSAFLSPCSALDKRKDKKKNVGLGHYAWSGIPLGLGHITYIR